MTQKEALLFFPFEEGDDLHDLYEERLFEFSQFFISKTPIRKVFQAKEKKMMQMHEAFVLLGGRNVPIHFLKQNFSDLNPTETILETFNNYQTCKNQIKNKLTKSVSAIETSYWMHQLIELEMTYSEKWFVSEIEESSQTIISKEPDPMSILSAIKEFNSNGGFTFADFVNKRNILPELLLNEMKRLSLYRKLEKNG